MEKKNILVIEDDAGVLNVLDTILTVNNFTVKGLDRTDDILDSIEKYEPDLVLTDFLLNGMNGGKICQQIKGSKRTCHIPVILISAYQDLASALGNFGFDAFISKPFDIDNLVKTVNNLLVEVN